MSVGLVYINFMVYSKINALGAKQPMYIFRAVCDLYFASACLPIQADAAVLLVVCRFALSSLSFRLRVDPLPFRHEQALMANHGREGKPPPNQPPHNIVEYKADRRKVELQVERHKARAKATV